jgi:hypothetical protein
MNIRSCYIVTLFLGFAGSGFVQKNLGLLGVISYWLLIVGVVWFALQFGKHLHPWMRKYFRFIAVLCALITVAMFAVLNPWEDGRGPGKSSDRDEGLNMAVERIMHGETPYYPQNSVAGPLSLLPGSIVIAAPFVALGDSGYQNVFCMFAFCVLAAWHFRDRVVALSWLMLILFLSPAVAYEYISGGDLIANGIYVPLSLALAIHAWGKPESAKWQKIIACLFVGVCLTSRSNLPFLVPLYAAAIWRVAGFKSAIVASVMTSSVIILLTVPIYLHDPAGFTPLISRKKLALVDHAIPHMSWYLVALTAVVGTVVAVRLLRRSDDVLEAVFRYGALVMIAPMIGLVLLHSVVSGHLEFGLMLDRFGLLFLFFAVLGWGKNLFGKPVYASYSVDS